MSHTSRFAEGQPLVDINQLVDTVEDPRASAWALTGLFVLAAVAALFFAREVLLPLVLALILSAVLAPIVRGLQRLRIPTPIGAGLTLLVLLAALIGAAYYLSEPANLWLEKAPQSLRIIGVKLHRITGQVKDVNNTTAEVQDITQDIAGANTRDRRRQEVTLTKTSLADQIFAASQKFLLSIISTLVLLYFLLASGDLFLRKIIAVTPRLADKKRAVDITRQIETEVARYLATVTLINAALGGTVALMLYFLNVPDPVFWGALVGLLNFVPYFGDIASLGVLTIVGLFTFDELWRCALVPIAFCLLTGIEGFIITPHILGRRLSLNPVVVALSVLFWTWLWGFFGAVLAVPILVVVKTFCDRVPPLQTFSEFLGA